MWTKLIASILVLLILSGLHIDVPSTYACSCAGPPSPEVAQERASAIFRGKAIAVQGNFFNLFGGANKTVLFEVEETWKGLSQSQIIVSAWEKCCGYSMIDIQSGESFLVFAELGYGGKWETAFAHGTQPVGNAGKYVAFLGQGKPPTEAVNLEAQFRQPMYTFLALVAVVALLISIFVFLLRRQIRISAV